MGLPRGRGWEEPTLELSARDWREDLSFFAKRIVSRHAEAFHDISKSRFDSSVASLENRLT